MSGYVFTIPQWSKPKKPSGNVDNLLKRNDFKLQERDLDILEFFLNHPFVITEQVAKLFYNHCAKPTQNASRRLKTLYDMGLLWRTRPFVSKGKGTHQYIFCITKLAYNLITQVRELDYTDEINFQECDNVVEMSRIAHELELNEFCIELIQKAKEKNLEFNWSGTKRSWQKITPKTPGSKGYVISPDAMIRVDNNIYHIEYERYCDKDNFYKKCMKWKRYRQDRAWKELYPKEPIILVVGNKAAGEVVGHYRRVNSIDQLIPIAKSCNMDDILFLYNEDWRKGIFDAYNVQEEKINLFEIKEMDIWSKISNVQ
ncbi:replication-relaxation family protein [Peptococcaceae bacterium 1198_IL3148]